ncbi:hypothetical protein UNPA324_05545 [Bradyrhizobium sp. UNPA324]|nr:hypothetical protein UNPA324_05545 [Bradyrhizobium sp. UNPA324]
MAQSKVNCRSIRGQLGYSVETAGRMIGLGRSAAYRAAQVGVIPARRVGLKLLIVPKASWDAEVKRLLGPSTKARRSRKSGQTEANAT